MEKINQFEGIVCPLGYANVDKNQIIPKQYSQRIEKNGLGKYLFYDWRYDKNGLLNKDFVLNQEQYKNATILVVWHNFGYSSACEHVEWSLLDYGFRVIIAPSFPDIFYNNCLRNGMLLISLDEEKVTTLLENSSKPYYKLHIDLENQFITDHDSFNTNFEIEKYSKELLLNGYDEIQLTIQHLDLINQYEEGTGPSSQ